MPAPQRRTFCKLCYANEKGKSTYLSHTPKSNSFLTKARLNAIIDKCVPPQVLEQEHGLYAEQEEEAEVQNGEHKHYFNSPPSGLNMLQQVPMQILTLTDKIRKNIHIELDNRATVNYITMNEAVACRFKILPNS